MKQSARQKLTSHVSYEEMNERKEELYYEILKFEITDEMLTHHLDAQKVLVIVSEKHKCIHIVYDWPEDGESFENPITGGKTTVFLSQTDALFLDSDGELVDLQLEVHPLN